MQAIKRYGKWQLLALAGLVATGLLAGCSGSGNKDGASGSSPAAAGSSSEDANAGNAGKQEPAKITMWVKSTPEEQALFKEEADAFNQQQQTIQVEIVPFGTDQFTPALQAAISSNSLPDIFQQTSQIPLTQMKKLGLIQEIPFEQTLMDQFDQGTWVEGLTLLENQPYVWPNRSFKTAASVMFYNKQMMRDMGLDPEKPPATWDELSAQAKLVTDKGNGDIYGLSTGLKQDWFVEQLLMQMATSVDGSGIQSIGDFPRIVNWKDGTLFQPQAVKETVLAFKQWKNDKIMDPNALILTSAEAAASFGEGKSAFHLDGQWQLAFLKSKYPDLEFGITLLPSKSGVPTYYGTKGGSDTGFVVAKSSKHIEAVTEWLTHLSQVHYKNALERGIAMSPIPEVNRDANVNVSPEQKMIIDVSDKMFRLVPSPALRNPAQVEVMTNLKANTAKQPLGPTLQSYLNKDNFDLDKFLSDYAAEQQQFLQKALDAVPGTSIDEWKFADWDINQDYTADKYK